MAFFNFDKKVEGSYYSKSIPYARQALGAFKTMAQCNGVGSGGTGAGGAGALPSSNGSGGGAGTGFGFQGSGYNTTRFNPVYDRLEEGSVVEDWIPKDASGLNKLFRLIYLRDAIAGSAVDIYKSIPFSNFKIVGVNDPTIRKTYEDMLHAMGFPENLSEWAGEYLVLGKLINSLIWNDERGYFDDFIPHDPDFLKLTPVPYRGIDPLCDLVISPAIRQFINSQDERVIPIKKKLSDKLIFQAMQTGGLIPLQPENTLYIPRKATPYDYLGTSLYTRILPFYAIEKALLNATVSSARRRSRSILHIQAGIENLWEPQTAELENIAGMFIQADEDPVGAVVVTRNGVEASELRAGADFWKLSDEWTFLTEGKMRSLGISDAFMSGEASYNTMESAMSIFIETLRTFRDDFCRRIFPKKLFMLTAQANHFTKTKQSDLNHGIRTQPYKNDEDIPFEELQIPQIVFDKQLRPEADENYLGILSTMEEKGIPISKQTWAAAGGIDLEKQLDMLESDLKLQERISEYKKKMAAIGGEDGGEEEMPSFASTITSNVASPVYKLNLWKNKEFIGLTQNELALVISVLNKNKRIFGDMRETLKTMAQVLHGSTFKTELAAYLLMRSGVKMKFNIEATTVSEIAKWISKNFNRGSKKAIQEFISLQKITGTQVSSAKRDAEYNQLCNIVNTPKSETEHIISYQEEKANIPDNSTYVVNGLTESEK